MAKPKKEQPEEPLEKKLWKTADKLQTEKKLAAYHQYYAVNKL